MAVFGEERFELGRIALDGRLAPRAPDRVDDLVLEDPGEPGAQVRAPGEGRLARERGDERVLDRILRGVRVAQLQRGIAQEVRAFALDPRSEIVIHGGVARFYKGLETGPAAPTSGVPIQERRCRWQT